jgi:hypothetical protein
VYHKERIRAIESDFRTAHRTEVIEPGFAHSFLNMPERRIEALVARILAADDLVFKRALAVVQEIPSDTARTLLMFVVLKTLLDGDYVSINAMQHPVFTNQYESVFHHVRVEQAKLRQRLVHSRKRRLRKKDHEDGELLAIGAATAPEQLPIDLEKLDSRYLTREGEAICVIKEQVQPLSAILLDWAARYEMSFSDLFGHALNVFGMFE